MMEKVRVHYHFRKHMLSVSKYIKGKGWRVVEYVKAIQLDNAVFKVYEAGRQRTLKTNQRNVHAYVFGEIKPLTSERLMSISGEVTYNPYRAGYFTDKAGNAVHTAKIVIIMKNKIYI